MMSLLTRYVKLLIDEAKSLARVPNQLVSDEDDEEGDDDAVDEFSSLAGGSISGFTAPLGMSGDSLYMKKPRRKDSKKKR